MKTPELTLPDLTSPQGMVNSTCLMTAWIEREETENPEPVHVDIEFFQTFEEAKNRSLQRYEDLSRRMFTVQIELLSFGSILSDGIEPEGAYQSLLHEQKAVVHVDPWLVRQRKAASAMKDIGFDQGTSNFKFVTFKLVLDEQDVVWSDELGFLDLEDVLDESEPNHASLLARIRPYVFELSCAMPSLDFCESDPVSRLQYALSLPETPDILPYGTFRRSRRAHSLKNQIH